MSYVMLKGTSNLKYQELVGRVGDLTILDNGRFAFEFVDTDGVKKVLSSGVTGCLGDLNDVRSKEVNIVTKNSTYDFEKLENYLEEAKLFSHTYGSVESRIATASEMRDPGVGGSAAGHVKHEVGDGYWDR